MTASLFPRLFGPAGPKGLSKDALAGLPRSWMTAACMDARFRRAEGWLGLSQCDSDPRAFTCRIDRRPGVYGLIPATVATDGDPATVDYTLCYFPDADEPLLDSFAISAAILASDAGTPERLRDFPAHPDLIAAFSIASLRLAVSADGAAIGLALTAERRRRVLSEAGIAAPGGGFVVEPGAADEDLPAFEIARDLAAVLAAGLTVSSGAAPSRIVAYEAPSSITLCRADGTLTPVAAAVACRDTDRLVWGEASALGRCLEPLGAHTRADAGLDRYRRDPIPLVPATERPESYGDRPRLIVLSGFLGSGKTSFLNQFIEYHVGRNELVTVIQNELGETGVDAMLLEGDESVMAVDAGCVCCTLAGALGPAIRTLKERFAPDMIVLETTGLANPLNMVEELRDLDDLVRLEAVVTVVDAARYFETIDTSEIASGQIAAADTLVLNKCDLVDDETLVAIHADLARRNAGSSVIEARQGRVNPKLLGAGFAQLLAEEEEAEVSCCCGHAHGEGHGHGDCGGGGHGHEHGECDGHHGDDHGQCCAGHHDHGHGGGHCQEHGRGHHHAHAHDHAHDHASHLGEGFSYLKLILPDEVDIDVLSRLLVDCPDAVDRVKGVVKLKGVDEPQILQFVPGHAEFVAPERPVTEPPFLIVIGRGVDSPDLSAHWAPLTEEAPELESQDLESPHVVH
ncbi:CobW family GTP-binding protein [Rhodobium gokarnense]|uniref:G3E family GTPase n=1 Tax=Rhodobium gokarnense TaxID=364296 RepID=A0ABT3HGT2_9HYPH|nr:CobW family GTP-binding protein [Rhodobium gokarnense]MCW2309615.1 G3E family GTPase [Rhodobium gokarnense]